MEPIIKILLAALENPTQTTIALLGWGLYLIEHFYVMPKKERKHQEDLKKFGTEYKELAANSNVVITKFMVLLEVIKDRLGRVGN